MTAPAACWRAWVRQPASGKGRTWTWTCPTRSPSNIRGKIQPGGQDRHFEDSGANGFELPGTAPSADTAFKDVAYDVTIAATQTFNNGQFLLSATRGPGTEAKAAIESKIAGYRAALADVQPLTNRHTKVVVLAFASSGWTDPTVHDVCLVWSNGAGLLRRRHQTRTSLKSPYLDDGWTSFGR